MEWSLAVVWTCLLGARLTLAFSATTSETVVRPRLLYCVFLHRANVTCHWEAGDASATSYTLEVRMKNFFGVEVGVFVCTTSGTSCTADMKKSSVRFKFCVNVTAHGPSGNTSTSRPCQDGVDEVRLEAVSLISMKPVRGKPRCLNITWNRSVDFPPFDDEIKDGKLKSQIEFTAQGQSEAQVANVTVKDLNFQVCLFRSDTSYTVRLRHSYQEVLKSPWSPWSNARQGRTGEDAPSAAPALWRRVKHTDENGRRDIELLWKPLPQFLANGRVLFYNVTCQMENARLLTDLGSCREVLHSASTSCSLRLPAERCSCALTASTSAGTSPEARIWFLGASETEPPPPSHITATPLDDNSFDVHWTAPVNRPVSGFVVEWFAVREKESGVVHWERLNSSTTALVITEGIQPMERYAISVKALYGDKGAGQNRTVHNYTRQGAPSAGPEVRVQRISGSTVDFSWSPVPVELLRGFVRNYTVSYSTAGQPPGIEVVRGDTRRHTLTGLLAADYNISIRANTDGGAGAAGLVANVRMNDGGTADILMYTLLPLSLTSLALVLMVCLAQTKMVKQKLCPEVPDPSNSSLTHWTQKIALETMKRPAITEKAEIKYSEVVMLGESELQNLDPDKNRAYQSVCNLQTYSSHRYSPLQAQTPQNARKSEQKYIKSKTASNTDLSSYPSVYSSVVLSQTLSSPPAPLVASDCPQSSGWLLSDIKLQLGGDSEPSVSRQGSDDSPLSQKDELKSLHHLLRRHQSPVSFSDFSSISQSSVLLSCPAEVKSPRHPFSQGLYNSVPSLQPELFGGPDPLSDTFTTPHTHSVCVDFSYYPLE